MLDGRIDFDSCVVRGCLRERNRLRQHEQHARTARDRANNRRDGGVFRDLVLGSWSRVAKMVSWLCNERSRA